MSADINALRRGLEVEGDTIDAVAKTGRRRAVFEDVTEVSAATAAVHFRAFHTEGAIDGRAQCAFKRREETGPAGAALELALGDKERLSTARAGERTRTVLGEQRTGARTFGAVSAQDVVLLWRQRAAPFLVGFLYLEVFLLRRHHIAILRVEPPRPVADRWTSAYMRSFGHARPYDLPRHQRVASPTLGGCRSSPSG
jgi:hypothetical protein